jgi:hypothetical protein
VRIVTSSERLNDLGQELSSSGRVTKNRLWDIVKVGVGFPFVAKVSLDRVYGHDIIHETRQRHVS